jgi:hypothetical protein
VASRRDTGLAPNPGSIPGSRKRSVPGPVHSIPESCGSQAAVGLPGSNPLLTQGTVESPEKRCFRRWLNNRERPSPIRAGAPAAHRLADWRRSQRISSSSSLDNVRRAAASNQTKRLNVQPLSLVDGGSHQFSLFRDFRVIFHWPFRRHAPPLAPGDRRQPGSQTRSVRLFVENPTTSEPELNEQGGELPALARAVLRSNTPRLTFPNVLEGSMTVTPFSANEKPHTNPGRIPIHLAFCASSGNIRRAS